MVLLDLGQDIVRYLQTLLGSYVSMQYNTDKQQEEDKLKKIIMQTLVTPPKLEYYLLLWKIYSFYTVLKMFLLIPLELIIGTINSLLSIMQIALSKYITFFSVMTLMVSHLFLQEQYSIFDPSFMYHLFRGQSTLKLYGLIFAIQIAEKIFTKLGKYLYIQIKEKLEIPTVEVIEIIPEITVSFLYTIIHTYIIFLQFNIFIVFINASMQNFIIFFFVTNLTKMKGNVFKKLDEKGYIALLNLDAKNRLHKIIYIVLFKLSQYNRHIPDIETKLIFLLIVGPILDYIQHIAILIQSKQLSHMQEFRKKMFYKMYIKTDNQTFLKCLKNDFTVIPFTVFFIKEVEVVLYANFTFSNEIILLAYINLVAFLLLYKICMILIRKLSLILYPLSDNDIKQLDKYEENIKQSQVSQVSKDKDKESLKDKEIQNKQK